MDDPTASAKRARLPRRMADSFKPIDSAERLRVILLLADGARLVPEIRAELGTSQPAVAYHLCLLRQGGFVISRRAGYCAFYSLTARGQFLAKAVLTLAAIPGPHGRVTPG